MSHYYKMGCIVSDTQFIELKNLANNAKIISLLKFLLKCTVDCNMKIETYKPIAQLKKNKNQNFKKN